jgi:hypothetical protein
MGIAGERNTTDPQTQRNPRKFSRPEELSEIFELAKQLFIVSGIIP